MKQFKYILTVHNKYELCIFDERYFIVGVYDTFDEALCKMKEEMKSYYNDKDKIREVTYNDEFENGYRVLYDIYYDDELFFSILEIKI